MKYPFEKKSFWIILSALSLVALLIIGLNEDSYSHSIRFDSLIISILAIFTFDYLIHLIFSKPETKK
jgi:hypothetical protein